MNWRARGRRSRGFLCSPCLRKTGDQRFPAADRQDQQLPPHPTLIGLFDGGQGLDLIGAEFETALTGICRGERELVRVSHRDLGHRMGSIP